MSVGEESTECPLCMEPLELDDINFFPCTCGYQICRFCWHRIRTDENGLCPACRKAYPEDPAEFKPLTEDELQRIKKERRQKEAQRKQKAAENRKHLANVRVVQKNLVFVVGLSQRLADPEVLKKHEYFGKFGKTHKVVINQSTSYAGAQGPSASAYVTYHKPEDALKAIQAVNNIHVDGRTLKASLGTTKYCSHFLRGSQCPKLDCMYLHELGEEAASFTKEEMQQGKHQEYEQKLYEFFMNSQNLATNTTAIPPSQSTSAVTVPTTTNTTKSRKKTSSPVLSSSPDNNTPPPHETKEAWPSLPPQSDSNSDTSSPVSSIAPGNNKPDRLTNGNLATGPLHSKTDVNAQSRAPGCHRNGVESKSPDLSPGSGGSGSSSPGVQQNTNGRQGGSAAPTLSLPKHSGAPPPPPGLVSAAVAAAVGRKLPFQIATDSMSLFSSTNGFPAVRHPKPPQQTLHPLQSADDTLPTASEIPDSIAVSSSTDWQAAFGFSSNTQTDTHDDDLGFDPWNESAKGLAEIIENESFPAMSNHQHKNHFDSRKLNLPYSTNSVPHPNSLHSPLSTSPRQPQPPQQPHHPLAGSSRHPPGMPQLVSRMAQMSQIVENKPKNLPPGFTPNHLGAMANNQMAPPTSKILGLMHFPPSVPPQNVANHSAYGDMLNSDSSVHREGPPHPQNEEHQNDKDWQEGLRALLPNINISFGAAQQQANEERRRNCSQHQQLPPHKTQHNSQKNWSSNSVLDRTWDPAIVTSGNVADGHSEEPHWMASLQQLTDDSSSSTAQKPNHRPPLVQQMPSYTVPSWGPQSLGGAPHPPPGFNSAAQMRPFSQVAPELTESYQ